METMFLAKLESFSISKKHILFKGKKRSQKWGLFFLFLMQHLVW